jgi:hypothetical protein
MLQQIARFETPGLTDETYGLPIASHVVELQKNLKGVTTAMDSVASRLIKGGRKADIDQFLRALAHIMESAFEQIRSTASAMPPIDKALSFVDFWEDSKDTFRENIEQTLLPAKASIETLFPKGIDSVVGTKSKKQKRSRPAAAATSDEY